LDVADITKFLRLYWKCK